MAECVRSFIASDFCNDPAVFLCSGVSTDGCTADSVGTNDEYFFIRISDNVGCSQRCLENPSSQLPVLGVFCDDRENMFDGSGPGWLSCRVKVGYNSCLARVAENKTGLPDIVPGSGL